MMFLLHCCVLFLPLHLRWRGRVSSNLIIIYIQHLVIIGLGCCLCGVGIVIPPPHFGLSARRTGECDPQRAQNDIKSFF